MKTKSKIALSLIVVIILTVLATVALVAVFAATRQEITSTIRVRYTAQEVSGEATARWKVGNEDWQPMTVGGEADGDTSLTFGLAANENASLSPTDKDIHLSVENNYIVFEYKFTNTGDNDFAIDLFYTDDETKDANISVFCLNSDDEISSDYKDNIKTAYGDWTTTKITGGGEKYVYILASILNIGKNAGYSGTFQFNLDGKDYSSYIEVDPTGTITGLNNNNLSVLRIPSEIDGTAVTKIAKGAIVDNTTLTEIIIPDSVTEIEQGALNSNLTNLKYISIPFVGNKKTTSNTFKYIFGAYSSPPTTLTNVIITGGNAIGSNAFSQCYDLTSVTIPQGVTSIGQQAFYYCSGLIGNLTIPEGVTSIGQYAFDQCYRLTSVIIPRSVESIGVCAFRGCDGLTSIKVDSKNEYYTSRDKNGIECNIILSIQGETQGTLISGFNNSTIQNDGSVTSIGEWAFAYCSKLTGNLTIPQGVTSIGQRAFYGCSGLTGDLVIPQGVTSIGNFAFYDCSGLQSVTIPSSITSIESGVFNDCSGLTEVTIESEYAYTSATSKTACGSLLNYAKTVRVLSSLVVEGHKYINETNFPTITTEEDGKYTVYKK